MTPISKECLDKFDVINLPIRQDPKNDWRLPFKKKKNAMFLFVLLSIHPRSRRGAERIRQSEGRWSRPVETALERSGLTENFQFRESDTEAETKRSHDQIPVPSKRDIYSYEVYIYTYI